MQAITTLVQIQVAVGVFSTLILLYFQVRAHRLYRKPFFATLASSSILGIVATVMASAAYFVRLPDQTSLTLYWLSTPVAVLAALLGVSGCIKLYRAFDELMAVRIKD